jgi:sugar lactone lactonase YvrE
MNTARFGRDLEKISKVDRLKGRTGIEDPNCMFRKNTIAMLASVAFLLSGCTVDNVADKNDSNTVEASNVAKGAAELPKWIFSPDMIFPAGRSLKRPEDGVVLNDGRLIVADQDEGLRFVSPDGNSRPFGKMMEAGYKNDPPENEGGANGVSVSPKGNFIIVSDVYKGGIYSVDPVTEATEKIYQHEFGVNSAGQDSNGGVWFTQSTRNDIKNGSKNLWRSVAVATPDGALFYIGPPKDGARPAPIKLGDGFVFANGLALDEKAGYLYLAETLTGKVIRYRADFATGEVTEKTDFYNAGRAIDNIELDQRGRIWMALPLHNEIIVLDPTNRKATTIFRVSTPKGDEIIKNIDQLIRDGKPWLEHFTPDVWSPAPGAMTGVIFSPNDGPVYVSGLGNALIRLER